MEDCSLVKPAEDYSPCPSHFVKREKQSLGTHDNMPPTGLKIKNISDSRNRTPHFI